MSFADAVNLAWSVKSIAGLLRGLREWIVADRGIEAADKVLPNWQIDNVDDDATRAGQLLSPSNYSEQPQQESKLTTKTPAEIAADLAAREAAVKAREDAAAAKAAEFAEAAKKTRRDADDVLLTAMVKDGKLSPTAKPELLNFMGSLDGEGTVQFAETGDKQTPHAFFRGLLAKAGKIVDFGEVSKQDGEGDALSADPQERGRQLADKAIAFMEEKQAKGVSVTLEAAMAEAIKQEKAS
ncbi:MAG: hypothetical protein WDN08_05340 [Rhizomicrobium sp.]